MSATTASAIVLSGFSMSIGWGIRGQFGHEYGAAMAGVLGAIAVVLAAGRADWWTRVHYFALFGALGWSFGGSMSYMKVIAYTHSPDMASLWYGFACVFVIGFLWAAPGGFGTALPAYWDRATLTDAFPPILAVLGAWWLQEVAVDRIGNSASLDWFDTDWLGASTALAAALATATIRRRIDAGTSLILHMAIGWWTGFLLLTVWGGLRMTPPRGDNWSGCVGLVAALIVYCRRNRLDGVLHATLVTGLLGGTGYALAQTLKLAVIATGVQTNTHSILEQLQGLFHGAALAIAMLAAARHAPRLADGAAAGSPRRARWTETVSVFFVLILVTYVNFRKSPNDWIRQISSMPEWMYGLRVAGWLVPSRGWIGWMEIAYIALGAALVLGLRAHYRRGLPLIPVDWLGRAQLLYLVFLWAIVFINFAHVLGRFAPQRLITEGVIAINAAVCTLLALADHPRETTATDSESPLGTRRMAALGAALAACAIASGALLKPILLGERNDGAGLAIRFGPGNTNDRR